MQEGFPHFQATFTLSKQLGSIQNGVTIGFSVGFCVCKDLGRDEDKEEQRHAPFIN